MEFCFLRSYVASYTGAWIETTHDRHPRDVSVSHPIRVRGLKHAVYVVPVGVEQSHPIRVRGLKHAVYVVPVGVEQSHPIRVRGLKQD